MISLDTETTGLDPYHGTKPFLVTTCDEGGLQLYWEWDVDPYTREPNIPFSDLQEIQTLLDVTNGIILQNSTFDIGMLDTLNGYHPEEDISSLIPRWFYNGRTKFRKVDAEEWLIIGDYWEEQGGERKAKAARENALVTRWQWKPWQWEKTHDTLFTAHMLASCQRRDLTTLALVYLGLNIQPYEDWIKDATSKARRLCRTKQFKEQHGEWAIAAAGREDMPSAKGECWKADMWLPRAFCKHAPEFLPSWEDWEEDDPVEDHPWQTVCNDYANSDSEVTLPIFLEHRRLLKEKGLWGIYEERRKLLRIVDGMKKNGITVNKIRKDKMYWEYQKEVEYQRTKCLNIAGSNELRDLPVNGRSNALNKVIFEDFGLISPKTSKKTGEPSMDRSVIDGWIDELNPTTKPYHFLTGLRDYRKRKTAMSFMEGYERFWLPATKGAEWFTLHPNLNATGTNTLRWSSSNPNEQNISKIPGFNLRYCFGPLPGRCWASLDYENLELRIPAYGAGEQKMINLFERATEPPFYGSNHLLNFSEIYADIWDEAIDKVGEEKVAEYIKTEQIVWYKKCKNTGFAKQYGAQEKKVDETSGRTGTYAIIEKAFRNLTKYNNHWVEIANATGYVETMPDIEICPDRGYPLQCSRTHYNKVSPTIPLSYHVQGTACWIIFRAMVKVQAYLDMINVGKEKRDQWFMALQVHDELVIDFPFRDGMCRRVKTHLKNIRSIMESCGEFIKVPLRVGCEIHEDNWSVGYSLAV